MRMIAFYGPNIITTEFDEWKRHRKVAKTAFSEGNIRLVWVESSTIVKEWLDALDGEMSGGLEIHIDAIEQIKRVRTHLLLWRWLQLTCSSSRQLTRLVIQSAAFGYRSSWAEDSHSVPPPGHKITIREAVAEAAELIVEKAISPRWLYYLPIPFLYPRLARTEVAYGELSKYFKEMIRNAKAEGLGQKEIDLNEAKEGIGADLFRRLIVANETEGTLSDDELLSNVFVRCSLSAPRIFISLLHSLRYFTSRDMVRTSPRLPLYQVF
jgi:cytochrome P450